MNHWKGLMIAAAIDLVWIMGAPVTAPDFDTATYQGASAGVVGLDLQPARRVEGPERARVRKVEALHQLSGTLDSLMLHLQQHPGDVDAMHRIADLYAQRGWWNDAIGPLARAIQLDPERWRLWSALDRAVENAGMAMITDAELTVRARRFVEAIEMAGHGC